ncbi:MAG: DNA polymerase IV [Bacteroidetes bacterium]|nr:DNA polymerase IV [Bacteroidota bacterium]
MSPQRLIAHFDLDSFFVSVEILSDPSLKGKPVLVGGRERGVVAACSYEARKFGIHSAMPMKTAMRLCPQATVIKGKRGEYSRYSRWVTDIIAAEAPLFEKASIDEFYLDLTGMSRFFNPFEWTKQLREKIMTATGLPISFGLAANKMLAKMATNEAKPNGFLYIEPGQEIAFLDPLPVNKVPGVGDHTFRSLLQLGIETMKELREAKPVMLEHFLGKYGLDLWHKAHGRHDSEVSSYHEAKSVSTESTFEENTKDMDFLMTELVRMTEKIAFELRQDNKMAGCMAVKIRYPDFETTSRQTSIPYTFYDDELIPVAKDLFHKLYRKGQPIRLMGVRLSELTGEAVQTNLFSDTGRKAGLYKAIDDVKNRFGKASITKARGK